MIWKTYELNSRLQKVLSDDLGVSPLLAQLLINRGIKNSNEAQRFLFGDLASCHDPFLMKDMDKAVHRIKRAIEKKEKILIYGDYDVDGVSAMALLADCLEKLGASYETFIPNRLEEGYGLNLRAVALAHSHGIKLIVTVDCGINSVKEVECASSYGIDVIVTDHHEVKKDKFPKAYAVVDPHQEDCPYPFKYLAGVAVAYKLARALLKGNEQIADNHLDLVALGTIADIVPLNGENRVLAKAGLKKIRNTEKEGLRALMEVAGIEREKITSRHIGFILAPRINAMGRVGSANGALELLMCKEKDEAFRLAAILDKENRNRQSIEKVILQEAFARVEEKIDLKTTKVIVLSDKAWHPGVIGIVASRLVDEYLKPVILITLKDARGKGSGRSTENFNLFGAINKSSEYLTDFGGHEQACGLKLNEDQIGPFTEKINAVADNFFTDETSAAPELKIDSSLPFSHIGEKLLNELKLLMPYGPDNHEPVFLTGSVKVKNVPRDIGKTGFKFFASCGTMACEAVTFKKNSFPKPRQGDIVDLAYTPSINSFRGLDSIQLNIKDLHTCTV